jgi:hypothetical protein
MRPMVAVISIAFALISCATSGTKTELTATPEFPSIEEAMVKIAENLPTESHQMVAVFSFAERGAGARYWENM